jgi:hypothetical protein
MEVKAQEILYFVQVAFCVSFGVWDILYYAWLWVLLGWPPSLLTWDVLSLIPVPWIGPVLAPLIVSICPRRRRTPAAAQEGTQ